MKMKVYLPGLLVMLLLLTACERQPTGAVGQLVSDRIEITAEAAEPITGIRVTEGDQVEVGQVLLTQNDERIEARLAEAEANIRRIEALLAEQEQGPREETIMAARADVEERRIEFQYRSTELQRLTELRQRNLTSVESVDLARKLMNAAEASRNAAQARLQELEAGTRAEQLEQTRYSLQQARAQLRQLQIEQQRLTLRAPVAAVVDSLPFEAGERPAVGAVVAVLLSGPQPHARVYVPEEFRVNVIPGDPVQVRVDGLDGMLQGTVRRVASDASFTPYFALTEDDRSRLSYVAEVTLPEMPRRLPDGVPVEAFFAGMQVPDDE
ncbi:MAG: HlyD family efflux transporter periplasmic adaptor subunit [Gammaproteobacteria bacterium]|nr:HlyD family efflux transporter periplasmic adaptor subunit [Pseudomonadales bacterium]MCP5348280.1 HlyD family efflux transporter periplasmic adaptor subunit [Pseudomonadales bacterium]